MNNKYIIAFCALTGFTAVSCAYAYKKIQTIKMQINLKAKEKEAELKDFADEKRNFKDIYSDTRISNVSLDNTDIGTQGDRAYVYSKLVYAKEKCLSCNYNDRFKYFELKEDFMDLFNAFDGALSQDGIDSKIIYLQSMDAKRDKELENIAKKAERDLEHRQQMELIEAENKKATLLHEADLDAAKYKVKTVADSVTSIGNSLLFNQLVDKIKEKND